jgi:hypothetical protein
MPVLYTQLQFHVRDDGFKIFKPTQKVDPALPIFTLGTMYDDIVVWVLFQMNGNRSEGPTQLFLAHFQNEFVKTK